MASVYCGNTGTSGSPRFITRGKGGVVVTAKNTMKKDSRPKGRPYGKINKGHTVPYGTMVGASEELRQAYYYYGYKEDSMLPELPCLPYEEEPSIDPEEELCKVELAEQVEELLDTLTPRQAKVLRMRFGIGLDSDYTLEEVGVAFRVTRERIRQIEARALRKIKHPYRSDTLRQFLSNDEGYKTTEQKKREVEARQREWREDVERRQRIHYREKTMPPEQKELWQELKPALEDVPWIRDLKVSKPEMYQELKELVGDLWGMSAKDIWKKYTRENI
jgi:RNA polymerase sigma factor (sigma-70 family)